MSDLLSDLKAIRDNELAPLRAEAGLPEREEEWDGDTVTDEKIMRYVEILESTVVGKASVLSLIAQASRPYARRDVDDACP